MKLYCHPISPFARKAMILARLGRVAVTEITPEKDGANGYAVVGNPLGKMPSLVLREGQSLFDSRVICEFLDGLSAAPLCPASGDARFTQLRQHALGDGLSEAVYNLRMETLRPSALHQAGCGDLCAAGTGHRAPPR